MINSLGTTMMMMMIMIIMILMHIFIGEIIGVWFGFLGDQS